MRVQTWACWAGWERRSFWNMPGGVPMYTEKAMSKKNGELDSNVGDRFLKHELQMQLMAENMEGMM